MLVEKCNIILSVLTIRISTYLCLLFRHWVLCTNEWREKRERERKATFVNILSLLICCNNCIFKRVCLFLKNIGVTPVCKLNSSEINFSFFGTFITITCLEVLFFLLLKKVFLQNIWSLCFLLKRRFGVAIWIRKKNYLCVKRNYFRI